MKKVFLSIAMAAFAATTVFGNANVPVKKTKQGTCSSCPKGKKCTPATTCSKPSCCK